MKKIYSEILKKAIPFYEKGREGDVLHVKWLYKTIPEHISPKEIDFDILMPVAILHDAGYSKVKKGSDPFNLDIRKLHSEEGAKIASQILSELVYPKEMISEIERLILKHDNWAFGDSFADEPILRIFNNFDFIWMTSKEGFDIVRKFTKQSPAEFYEQIKVYQENNEKRGVKWYNSEIEKFYNQMMQERKKEISKKV